MDQLNFILKNMPNLLTGYRMENPGGLLLNLMLAVAALVLGFILSMPLAAARKSNFYFARSVSRMFTEIIIGLPLIFIIIFMYSLGGQKLLGLNLTPFQAALIALTVYTASYQTEIFLAGLRAVPKDQIDAAIASGLSRLRVFINIELPVAVNTMVPVYAGQSISLFKDTSIIMIIGLSDLTGISSQLLNSNNEKYFFELIATVGFLYFVVAFSISRLSSRWQQNNKVIKTSIEALDC